MRCLRCSGGLVGGILLTQLSSGNLGTSGEAVTVPAGVGLSEGIREGSYRGDAMCSYTICRWLPSGSGRTTYGAGVERPRETELYGWVVEP